MPPAIELVGIVEKHDTAITINCGTYFLLYNVSFKVCDDAWIMPSFCEQFIFVNIYSVVLKSIITLIWRVVFCTFQWLFTCGLMLNL